MSSQEGTLLNTFVNSNKNNFPLKVVVTSLKETTTILNNHSITINTQLVLHGWAKHAKVLALSPGSAPLAPSTSDANVSFTYYAIPLTYQGRFKIKSKFYKGLSNLVSSKWTGWTKVVSADLTENPVLRVGDVVKVVSGDDDKSGGAGERDENGLITLSKRGGIGSESQIYIPTSCSAVFRELTNENDCTDTNSVDYNDNNLNNDDEYSLKQLANLLIYCDLEVQLVQPSSDVNKPIISSSSFSSSSSLQSTLSSSSLHDLPTTQNIILLNSIQEQSVYVSVNKVDEPAFQIPLRTLMYVKLKQKLDKNSSPLHQKSSSLQKKNISTLERCVEILPKDVFLSLLPPQRAFERFTHWYTTSCAKDAMTSRDGSCPSQQNKKRVAPLPPTQHRQHQQIQEQQQQQQQHLQQQQLQQQILQLQLLQLQPQQQFQQDIVQNQQLQQQQLQNKFLLQQQLDILQNNNFTAVPLSLNMDNINTTQQLQIIQQQLEQQRILHEQQRRLTDEIRQQQKLLIETREQLQQQLKQQQTLVSQQEQVFLQRGKNSKEEDNNLRNNGTQINSLRNDENGDEDSIGTATSLQSKESKEIDKQRNKQQIEIPEDGNLYKLNSEQFFEILRYIKLNQMTLERCSKQKLNGTKFASMSQEDMIQMGLLHPVIMHFKKSTFKRK